MNNLVSIIIPVYNAEKYLDEAIKSCINQTYSNLEIIAINDGSTDGSAAILDKYSDCIKIISQSNKGVSVAMNAGIKVMNGVYFKPMNADDILYPKCLEWLVEELERINDKKVIVHADCDFIDGEGNFVKDWTRADRNHLSQFEQNVILLDHDTVIHISSIYSKEVFKHGLYDESIKAAVDYELWLRLCLQYGYRLHLLEKKVGKYRRHENNLTARSLRETPNYAEDVRKKVLNRLEPKESQKYLIALKRYKRENRIPINTRTKNVLNNLVLKCLSPSSAKKVSNLYRTITCKQLSES